jgi:hypothetical protein
MLAMKPVLSGHSLWPAHRRHELTPAKVVTGE